MGAVNLFADLPTQLRTLIDQAVNANEGLLDKATRLASIAAASTAALLNDIATPARAA